jgi:hypothetical protein
MKYRILYDSLKHPGNEWFDRLYAGQRVPMDFGSRINLLVKDGNELRGNLVGSGRSLAQAFMVNEDDK